MDQNAVSCVGKKMVWLKDILSALIWAAFIVGGQNFERA